MVIMAKTTKIEIKISMCPQSHIFVLRPMFALYAFPPALKFKLRNFLMADGNDAES